MDLLNQAKALVDQSQGSRIDLDRFRRILPQLAEQLTQDQHNPALDLWGYSRNVDQIAGRTLVHPKLVTALSRLLKIKIKTHRGHHAGALHSYGYLLSWTQTPYGLKGDRWTERKIERALRLPEKSLSPIPTEGTLLSNLSYVMARVLAPESALALTDWAPIQLVDYPFSKLKMDTLIEIIEGPSQITLQTVITKKTPSSPPVLFHSVKEEGRTGFITVFSITEDFRRDLLEQEVGEVDGIKTQYNALTSKGPISSTHGYREIRTS